MHHILIIEDEKAIREVLRNLLERFDFKVSEANSVDEATEHFDLNALDVIIANLRLSGKPGTDLIRMTPTPILVMSNYVSQSSAIDSMNGGAVDFISLPIQHDEILDSVKRVLTEKVKKKKKACFNTRPSEKPFSGMTGKCPAMTEMFRCIRKVGQTNSPVLILGESGTGKELVAKALHEVSARKDANLITVNCAAIPEDCIESELFGHEKDAFIGATATHIGLVEEANKGTLFLDEIAELSLDAQARLLQVLQSNEFRKVGSVQSQQVDTRLISATHRDLNQLVKEGHFREDLYYRIKVMPLQIPPLRKRGVDIIELAEHKLNLCCIRLGVKSKTFSADAIQVITTYPWPGNVRELENAIERAVTLSEKDEILMDFLGLDIELVKIDSIKEKMSVADFNESSPKEVNQPEDLSLKDYFQRFVLEHQEQLNETQLAKKLGVSRKCLWERRQRFNIPRKKQIA